MKKIRENQCSMFFIIIIVFGIISQNANSQSVYVPLNHWVYNFIERLETKQVIKGVLDGTKPLSRKAIAEYLAQIHQRVEQGYNLNCVEQEQLDFLYAEFKEELNELIDPSTLYKSRINKIRSSKYIKKFFPRIIYQNNRNFLSWEQDQFLIFIDPILKHQRQYNDTDSLHNTEKVYQFTNGVQIWGNLENRLGFFINARDNKEWGTKKYRLGNYTLPRLGFVRATSPDFIYHDETEAYLKLGLKYVELTYGKSKNYWGPGYTGSLILSDYATSYDQFKLEVNYKKFKFTTIYAYLIDYHDQKGDSLQQRNYLAGHRLEFTPWDWLSLGLSETVVFTGRSFEPAYLNPVMFFRSAEHYLGSPDNMMMGFDFKCIPIKHLKFYGELLIDDIATSKLGTDWYGNKIALLGGIFFAEPFTIDNLDLRMEYVRIRPYVYSHENSLEYLHYGSLIGHRIGPNADLFSLLINHQLTRRLQFQGIYEYLRHGANSTDVNYGGNPQQFLVPENNTYPKFLGGLRETSQIIGFGLSYEIFRNFYFKAKISRVVGSYERNINNKLKIKKTNLFISLGINY